MVTESAREKAMKTSFGAILGLVLRRLRKEQKKTQTQIAKAIGVTQTQYVKIEQGRVNINMLKLEKFRQTFDLDSTAPIFEEVERIKKQCAELEIIVELRNTPLTQTDDLYGEVLHTMVTYGSFLREKRGDK